MTDAQRRCLNARLRVEATLLNPVEELLDAAELLVYEADARAENAEAVMAQLRPIWAQGWTTDSQAAQASANALSELWQLLYATDQTQALDNLRRLIASAEREEKAHDI